jgi:hypothetical protein
LYLFYFVLVLVLLVLTYVFVNVLFDAKAQHTSANQSMKNFLLTKSMAILSFGSQRFRLRALPGLSAIEVCVEGRTPRAVHGRLVEQVGVIIAECMKSLICFTAVSYCSRDNGISSGSGSGDEGLVFDEETFLIPLSQIVSLVDSHSVLSRPGGRRLLTEAQAKAAFRDWLGRDGGDRSSGFDVFLSYRWGPNDSAFVRCVYDRFSLYTVGGDNREVSVFLDRECLQAGR